MGKFAARARLERGHGAYQDYNGSGPRRGRTANQLDHFRIECATCGYTYETQMLRATCPGCSGRVLMVTDLSRLSHDGG